MPGSLTVAERIMLHISQFQKLKDAFDAPFEASQDGIASALMISRAHAAVELKKLKESGHVLERLAHIKRGRNKRKVYFLSPPGEEKVARIREFAAREGIDVGPVTDLRRVRGADLWGSLSDENRGVLAGAVVFRRPFLREALPETSIALLPVDRNGLVDLPQALRAEISAMVPRQQARSGHSRAADYWLDKGDYRERLYHLVASGRVKEAEILVASKGHQLLKGADQDLLEIVSQLESPSERYAARVRQVQAECARLAGDHDYSLLVSAEMRRSGDMRERLEGLIIEGKCLRDLGRLEEALSALGQARGLGLHVEDSRLECEMADTLIRAQRHDEALILLRSSARSGGLGDPDDLERAYYLIGEAYLRKAEPVEALRHLSKSLAITKSRDKAPWYELMAQAYGMAGMAEKAKEYEALAAPPRRWGAA